MVASIGIREECFLSLCTGECGRVRKRFWLSPLALGRWRLLFATYTVGTFSLPIYYIFGSRSKIAMKSVEPVSFKKIYIRFPMGFSSPDVSVLWWKGQSSEVSTRLPQLSVLFGQCRMCGTSARTVAKVKLPVFWTCWHRVAARGGGIILNKKSHWSVLGVVIIRTSYLTFDHRAREKSQQGFRRESFYMFLSSDLFSHC